MSFTRGSFGPPCDSPLDRTAGSTLHAPAVGGRSSTLNVFCGGCPEWPADWKTNTVLQSGESSIFNQVCNKYRDGNDNHGRPRSLNPITGDAVTVGDTEACVCGVQKVSDCLMSMNVTVTCPVSEVSFNLLKRLYLLIGFVSMMGMAFLCYVFQHFR